jgi:FAD/FMN-containing dehydrogenase
MNEVSVEPLMQLVGARHVITEPDLCASYETDWTGRFSARAVAVVRPGDSSQVAAVLSWCYAHSVPVVPQGGNTGLVGGSIPVNGGILLSLRRLDFIGDIDHSSGQLTVGAGATLRALQGRLAGTQWEFGVDLGSRDSATIGGLVATNAAGARAGLRGSMRAQIAGLEAVLGDGRVVGQLGGLAKDNTGYDLASLLVGSEGTLGVVTQVRLRLLRAPAHRVVSLIGMPSIDAASSFVQALRGRFDGIESADFLMGTGLDLVCEQLDLTRPFEKTPAVVLLVAWAGPAEPPEDLLEELVDVDGLAAVDAPTRAAFWRYREGLGEAVSRMGTPHKLDVCVPMSELANMPERITATVAAREPAAVVHLFGHLAEGNLHINITGLDPEDGRVDDELLRLVASVGGSIGAEHGVGRAKTAHVGLTRTAAEQDAYRAIKHALDPRSILNPGVLIPVSELVLPATRHP